MLKIIVFDIDSPMMVMMTEAGTRKEKVACAGEEMLKWGRDERRY